MSRKKANLPAGARLSDYLTAGVIAKTFPLKAVRKALRDSNRLSRRKRQLSAEAVVYYVIALGMFRAVSSREVLRCLAHGLRWAHATYPLRLVASSSISRARQRLGIEPFVSLRKQVVHVLADDRTRGGWYRELRVLAVDGAIVGLPRERRNKKAFGEIDSDQSDAARPGVRVTLLVEVGTRAPFAWEYGPCTESRQEQALRLSPHLSKGTILIAENGYASAELWHEITKSGGELVARTESGVSLPALDTYGDGSFLTTVHGMPARALDFDIDDSDAPVRRLVTTLLDPSLAPANELAAMYHETWDSRSARDEVKAYTLWRGSILRSKTPPLVEQEIEGLMLAHFAVRNFLHEMTRLLDEDPYQLAFNHSVRVLEPSGHATDKVASPA